MLAALLFYIVMFLMFVVLPAAFIFGSFPVSWRTSRRKIFS